MRYLSFIYFSRFFFSRSEAATSQSGMTPEEYEEDQLARGLDNPLHFLSPDLEKLVRKAGENMKKKKKKKSSHKWSARDGHQYDVCEVKSSSD